MRILIEHDDGSVLEYQDPDSFVLLYTVSEDHAGVLSAASADRLALYSYILQAHIFNILHDSASSDSDE